MRGFQKRAQDTLTQKLSKEKTSIDKELIETIAKYFAYIEQNWQEGVFELRENQLLFAYHLAYQALNDTDTPLALSLGCGEGKQEGFGVAMRAVWELYKKRENKEPKLLFLSATDNLITQMKNSIPLKEFEHLFVIDRNLQTSQAKKSGIYLCDFTTYLYIAVKTKKGFKYSLFDNLYKIFTDEIHALLGSSPYVISTPLLEVKNISKSQKKELTKLFLAYKELINTIKELYQKEPKLIAQSYKRDQASFNPYQIKKNGTLIEELLYDKQLAKKCNTKTKEEFFSLLSKVADAIAHKEGKDYYLHTDDKDDSIIGYSCSDSSTGKPMPNTRYQDRLLATLIALKHTQDITENQKEFNFVADTYLPREEVKITPFESIKLLKESRFITASATIGGISSQLERLGFKKLFLQKELRLNPSDKRVLLKVSERKPLDLLIDSIKASTPQVLITSKNAYLLKKISQNETVKEIFEGYELIEVSYSIKNPDTKEYEDALNAIKEAIYKNPLKKRLLLIQGIAEGSNIFKTTPFGEYEATIYKLDISAIDSITQTRYRVGVRGRAKGYFNHTVSTDIQTASSLRFDEVIKLNNTPNKTSLLMQIQDRILKENDSRGVEYVEKDTSRRGFITKALKLTAASMALNPIAKFLDKLFHLNLQNSTNLYARSIEYPPGIANCRDPAVKMAYYYLKYENSYNYKYSFKNYRIVQTILRDRRIKNKHYGMFQEIKRKTPFIEPAYWFVCAKANIGPDWSIYPRLKRENPALYWFVDGISIYFQHWINKKGTKNTKKNIETDFLKSIFYAANYNKEEVEKEVKKYLNSKENYSTELKKIFNKYKPNWDKMDNEMRIFLVHNSKKGRIMYKVMNKLLNEKDYNKRLVAQWSGFVLSVHYGRTNEYDKDMTINKFIEKPLRKIDPRVRGPPYFKL